MKIKDMSDAQLHVLNQVNEELLQASRAMDDDLVLFLRGVRKKIIEDSAKPKALTLEPLDNSVWHHSSSKHRGMRPI